MDDVVIDDRPDDDIVAELVNRGADEATARLIVKTARRAEPPDRIELPDK